MSEWNIPQIIRRFAFEEWGGTETVVLNTAKHLNNQNIQADILATSALSQHGIGTQKHNQQLIHRFPYYYPYLNLQAHNKNKLDKKGGNPYCSELYQFLMNQHNTLIHCHSMQRMAGMARQVSLKQKVPYVISFHGGYYDVPVSEISDMLSPVKHSLHYGKIVDLVKGHHRYIQDAHGIICVGYNEYLETKKKFPDKVVEYIPNGIELEQFSDGNGERFRQKYNISSDKKILLCVSRIDPQKNQQILLQALKELQRKDLYLVLIGPPTSPVYLGELQKYIKTHQLDNQCLIIEGLKPEDQDLIDAYHSASTFILPSIHEPFGIVALEAWSCKLPVITSAVGGLRYLIEDGKTGLSFNPNSLHELCSKIEDVIDSPELAKQIANQSHQHLIAHYSWSKVTEKLIKFYGTVLNSYHSRINIA